MSMQILGKQSLFYGIGHIITRSIGFLLLPLYTNYLSLEEYGVIALVYTFLGFMNIILHYGLDASLLKHYVGSNVYNQKTVLTNVYTSLFITTFMTVSILLLFKNKIGYVLFGFKDSQIIILVLGILFFDTLLSIHNLIIRAEQKPKLYICVSLSNVLFNVLLNIYFIIYLRLGINGVLIGNLISSFTIFLLTSPIIINRFSFSRLSFVKWKQLMIFGYPLLFSGIFSMILELSDRYIIRLLIGIEAVGVYNAGYKIGMIMMIIVSGFNMAWQPYFLNKKVNERKYIADTSIILLTLICSFWLFILLWSDTILTFQIFGFSFYGENYWDSINIIPYVALAYIFHACYLIQIPGYYLLEKTEYIAWIRFCGALFNIALNFLFIYIYGIIGAAVSTCLSYLIMAVLVYLLNKRLFPIQYSINNLFLIFGLLLLVVNLNYFFVLSETVKFLITILYPTIIIYLGGNKQLFIDLIKKK